MKKLPLSKLIPIGIEAAALWADDSPDITIEGPDNQVLEFTECLTSEDIWVHFFIRDSKDSNLLKDNKIIYGHVFRSDPKVYYDQSKFLPPDEAGICWEKEIKIDYSSTDWKIDQSHVDRMFQERDKLNSWIKVLTGDSDDYQNTPTGK